jgi:hypothetical protein
MKIMILWKNLISNINKNRLISKNKTLNHIKTIFKQIKRRILKYLKMPIKIGMF